MSDNDIQTILWLAKRLVYKYKEDPKIVSTIENILVKEQKEINKYKHICDSNYKNMDIIIDGLNKIKSYNTITETVVIGTELKSSSIDNANELFENFDFNQLTKIKK